MLEECINIIYKEEETLLDANIEGLYKEILGNLSSFYTDISSPEYRKNHIIRKEI
jgi:hypothetical protein